MRITGGIRFWAGAAACATLASTPSLAQNALGSGNSLDRNLQRGGSGVNAPVRDYAQEIKLRQAIVTGDVAGGRGFRGSVGYTASNDFRGSLGSNSIYYFVADAFRGGGSIGNANRGSPFRGVNALQQQLGLTVGGGVSMLGRSGAGASAGDISAFGSDPRAFTIDPFRQSESGLLSRSGSLRSTSGFVTGEASEAQRFDFIKRSGERASAGASALRGVFEEPMLRDRFAEAARESKASSDRPSSRLESDPLAERLSDPADPSPFDTRIESKPYGELLRSLRDPAEEASKKADTEKKNAPGSREPGTDAGFQQDAPTTPAGADGKNADTLPTDPLSAKLDALRAKLMPTSTEAWATKKPMTEEEEAKAKRDRTAEALDAGNIREFTKDVFGERRPLVPTFLDPAADTTGYGRNISEGEQALNEAKWFDAEEAFTRALRYKPGDPIASIARAHAQMGGGMFLSAAVNLRDTLRGHPELAAAKFEANLLPRADRLAGIMDTLRENALRDDSFGRDCALLLAYLGWQTGSPEDVHAGFESVKRVEKYLELDRDPLHDMLEAVWAE